MTADRDLADAVVDVRESHLDASDRKPDRARLALAIPPAECGDGRGLRQPVALENGALELLLECAQDLDRHRRAARDAQLQRGGVRRFWMVEHRRVHRRHALEHRGAIALDDLEGRAGVEPREQRQRTTDRHRRVQSTRLAEGMEQRQRTEHDRVRTKLEQLE